MQSELKDWGRNPPEGCCLETCEPITHWVVLMAGPEAAAGMPRLYEGETFRWAGAGVAHEGRATAGVPGRIVTATATVPGS
jgi:hypothetical protein